MTEKATSPSGQSASSGADGPARNADQGLEALADFVRVARWLDDQGLEIRTKAQPAVARVPATRSVLEKVLMFISGQRKGLACCMLDGGTIRPVGEYRYADELLEAVEKYADNLQNETE